MERPSIKALHNKKSLEAFSAITSFVDDLWEVFGNAKTVSPLALYHRLIQHIKFTDTEGIKKSVSGFETFLKEYSSVIKRDVMDEIPRDTFIKYGNSDSVYLEIQKYIYKADEPTKVAIRQHLLTINAILHPNQENITELEKASQPQAGEEAMELNIDTTTAEGKFVNGIMSKAKTAMEGVNTDDPMTAIMGIFKSGMLQDMMSGLQKGVDGGQLDMQKLLGTMQGAIGSIAPPPNTTTTTND